MPKRPSGRGRTKTKAAKRTKTPVKKSKAVKPRKSKVVKPRKSKTVKPKKLKTVKPKKSKAVKPRKSKVVKPRKSKVVKPRKSKTVKQTYKPEKKYPVSNRSPSFSTTSPLLEKFNFVHGPNALVELRNSTLNKHIYIFGEIHDKTIKCPIIDSNFITIDKFFKVTADANPSKIIDIFLEVDFISKQRPQRTVTVLNSPLADIRTTLANCLEIDKQACELRNARVHYADVRYTKPAVNYVYMYFAINNIFESKFKEAKILLDHITDMFPVNTLAILRTLKITKQLENIRDPRIRAELLEYFVGIMRRNSITESDLNSLHDMVKDKTKKPGLNSLDIRLTAFFTAIQDLYMLARIFRSFDGVEDSHYIMIYVGDYHRVTMQNFLTSSLNFQLVNESFSADSIHNYHCLNVKNFVQPFFSSNV